MKYDTRRKIVEAVALLAFAVFCGVGIFRPTSFQQFASYPWVKLPWCGLLAVLGCLAVKEQLPFSDDSDKTQWPVGLARNGRLNAAAFAVLIGALATVVWEALLRKPSDILLLVVIVTFVGGLATLQIMFGRVVKRE